MQSGVLFLELLTTLDTGCICKLVVGRTNEMAYKNSVHIITCQHEIYGAADEIYISGFKLIFQFSTRILKFAKLFFQPKNIQ